MASAAPGTDATMLQTGHDDHIAGTPTADVVADSIPKDQLRMIAERIDDGSNNNQPESSDTQMSGKDAERQGQPDLEHISTKPSTAEQSIDKPSEGSVDKSPLMERYRRMEAFLLKHRKEWESNNEPMLDADPIGRREPARSGPGFTKYGPWNWEWEYWTNPKYDRPNPFELTNELGAFPQSRSAEAKDEFDLTIDYGAARNRLRKNFEWDLDRLYLVEELTLRKRKEEEDARKRAELEKAYKPSTDTNDGVGKERDGKVPNQETGPILKLNYVEWFAFRSLSNIEEDKAYVIDVLVGDPIVDDDMGSSKFAPRIRRFQKPRHSDLGRAMTVGQAPLPERVRIHSGVLRTILASMLSTNPHSFGELNTFVFIRPFKSLFHCYYDIKSLIEKLEDKFSKDQDSTHPLDDGTKHKDGAQVENSEEQADQTDGKRNDAAHASESEQSTQIHPSQVAKDESGGKEVNQEPYEDDDPNDPTLSEQALRHLRSLRQFMDSEIAVKTAYLQTNECRKVFFSDLWYLFRPGDEVIGRDGKQAYRVIHVSSVRHRKAQPWDAWRWYNSRDTEEKKKKGPFRITCVYIDFDGSNIGPVSKTIDFKQFDGQMEIISLPVYPIRMHPLRKTEVSDSDWKNLELLDPENRYRQFLVNRGAKFLAVLGVQPMYYTGPTLGVRDEIESQVVIDFETAFSAEVGKEKEWQPSLEMLIGNYVSQDDDDEFDVLCSADCCKLDAIYDDCYIDDKQRSNYVNSLLPSSGGPSTRPSIAVLPQLLTELKDSDSSSGYSITDDELVIMSYRVFGFVLRHRQWDAAELDLTYLTELHAHRQPMQGPPNRDGTFEVGDYKTAFDNLVLEEKQKPMIQALVAQHFRDKVHKAGQASQVDIVKGKGEQPPDTQHTTSLPSDQLTAIAFFRGTLANSQHYSRGSCRAFQQAAVPDYMCINIREGDLGTTAKEVEKALDLNFTLANRWDCILLLDEADVFLAQRNKEDFQRNGLVAVFLRVLEYYAGVLFLTTNRVGDFDEAFTSRIHVSLYYPELNCDKTIKVFDINIRMIQERFEEKGRTIVVDDIKSFAEAHYNANADARWNGRQIRNACQTALALAEFEAQGSSHAAILKPDAVVHLKLSHFEAVQKAYLDFDKYMNNIYGTNSGTRAQEGKVRAIWDLVNDNTNISATGSGTMRDKKAFRDASRVKTEPLQQPVTPVTQPAMMQPQSVAPAQLQPMYASGNMQYVNPGAPPQGYYQNQMYPQYVQQPMGMPQAQQQQFAMQPQHMQMMQPQAHQPQAQSMMTPNASQTWNNPVPSPTNNSTAEQSRAVSEVLPRTPPSQNRQAKYPQQHQTNAAESPLFRHNIQEMYSAGGQQNVGIGYPQQQYQQQQHQQQQSGGDGGGGPPPSGQMSGMSGTGYPGAAPLSQGQWPGSQGLQSTGGAGQ
ncbi:hypothetical protein PG984_013127 [Apiospora sp. TS-2023a]